MVTFSKIAKNRIQKHGILNYPCWKYANKCDWRILLNCGHYLYGFSLLIIAAIASNNRLEGVSLEPSASSLLVNPGIT